MRAIERVLAEGDFDALDRVEPEAADPSTVLLAHPESHLAAVTRLIPEEGLARFDADTTASPKTLEAVLTAVGAATAAVDDVFTRRADNVFVSARPPGHHAEATRAMGFCFFNTAAIAARYAQKAHGAERVAIIDWDVHHGNGTQDIFWSDPSVFYASSHQMPLFPGTGAKGETGAGNIVNAPLADGDDGRLFREAFNTRILPALAAFQPDLVIVSAGFDAHHRDPLAGINLVEDDFDWATGKLMDAASKWSNGRLVSLLEGGYDLQGLSSSVATHVTRLMRG